MSDKELNSILAKADMEYEIMKDRAREYGELKTRIDKAIEYMDRRDLEWGSDEHNKMMNILKGVDEK